MESECRYIEAGSSIGTAYLMGITHVIFVHEEQVHA